MNRSHHCETRVFGVSRRERRVPVFAELAERKSVLYSSHEAGNPENAAGAERRPE
jgi:hypothetical protein